MSSNVALSYIITLTMVGFFLWVIRSIVRSLKSPGENLPPGAAEVTADPGSLSINWPVQIYTSREDEIAAPGWVEHINPGGAFLRSTTDLSVGQVLSLYLEDNGRTDDVDWYLLCWTPEGIVFLGPTGWTASWIPFFSGPLTDVPGVHSPPISLSTFPVGWYAFVFGVDVKMDGFFSPYYLYWDVVRLQVLDAP